MDTTTRSQAYRLANTTGRVVVVWVTATNIPHVTTYSRYRELGLPGRWLHTIYPADDCAL